MAKDANTVSHTEKALESKARTSPSWSETSQPIPRACAPHCSLEKRERCISPVKPMFT